MASPCALQVLDDGTYHEDDAVAGSHTLQKQDIIGLDWATSQVQGKSVKVPIRSAQMHCWQHC